MGLSHLQTVIMLSNLVQLALSFRALVTLSAKGGPCISQVTLCLQQLALQLLCLPHSLGQSADPQH